MPRNIFSFILLIVYFQCHGQTIQERLGYSKDTKLLILHADDIGVSHSENSATIAAFEKGMVISGSVMVPCPWFPQIARWSRENPEADLGLHLTLTSEWKDYKWGPVAPKEQVPSLVDENGFFHSGRDSLSDMASPADIEKEIRAQVQRAYAFGMDPTHLDPHMFLLFHKPEFLQVLMKVGEEYKIPVLFNKNMMRIHYKYDPDDYIKNYTVEVDSIYGAGPEDYKLGMAQYYEKVIRSLKPGLHYLFIHTAYDDPEMQEITKGYEYWDSKWRQQDYDFFTSESCKKILKEENIQLITWREIRDKLIRKGS